MTAPVIDLNAEVPAGLTPEQEKDLIAAYGDLTSDAEGSIYRAAELAADRFGIPEELVDDIASLYAEHQKLKFWGPPKPGWKW